ncbi:hypothetical protein WA026_004204 [Henosepilachna vigintioctopunctata]|uniref:Uncharacterized protein n=1 Tax=Henosepilachna vigintioctopunctata TaxID=420089 RepID=A0AAW1U9X8_9CUCU
MHQRSSKSETLINANFVVDSPLEMTSSPSVRKPQNDLREDLTTYSFGLCHHSQSTITLKSDVLNKCPMNKVEAFEMWTHRTMRRISWGQNKKRIVNNQNKKVVISLKRQNKKHISVPLFIFSTISSYCIKGAKRNHLCSRNKTSKVSRMAPFETPAPLMNMEIIEQSIDLVDFDRDDTIPLKYRYFSWIRYLFSVFIKKYSYERTQYRKESIVELLMFVVFFHPTPNVFKENREIDVSITCTDTTNYD